ncbi:5463_t:CDS:2 [Gigaspora margarita]|uniref:5463_t:CDS:1 n=1 Tax=Gigaspora margarita TaxID=4874 RepID=A0ABN7VW48_GIGMA|nr:5463_t:CDS:2 [Gigaspora margarita]
MINKFFDQFKIEIQKCIYKLNIIIKIQSDNENLHIEKSNSNFKNEFDKALVIDLTSNPLNPENLYDNESENKLAKVNYHEIKNNEHNEIGDIEYSKIKDADYIEIDDIDYNSFEDSNYNEIENTNYNDLEDTSYEKMKFIQ